MALTKEHKDFIILMDSKAKQILQHGSQEELLISLCSKMDKIKEIMDASSGNELDYYCEKYEGFYHYMKLLEQLAQGSIANHKQQPWKAPLPDFIRSLYEKRFGNNSKEN
ncbi:MAG: hypothetical protein K2X39_03635 [Silvanigrellaceae bacterium]|nr:hypothetical protein [Silvanigrellaceae bacterium]